MVGNIYTFLIVAIHEVEYADIVIEYVLQRG